MKILLVIAALCSPAFGQTAEVSNPVVICTESQACVIISVSDTTAVLQFGAATTWCTTISNPILPLMVNWSSPNLALCPFDPLPNANKTLVAQQKSTAYTVTYTLAGVKTSKTIAALTTPPPTPTPVGAPVPAMAQLMSDGTYTVTLSVKATVTQ